MYFPTSVEYGAGVIRGCVPGIGACNRSVSMIIACRSGNASISFAPGSCFATSPAGGHLIGTERVRSSLQRSS